jgi:DNA-binding GntR family transcriptional regulator
MSSYANVAADAGSAANIRSIRKGFRAHEKLVEHIEACEAEAAHELWSKHLSEAESYILGGSNPKTVLDLLG